MQIKQLLNQATAQLEEVSSTAYLDAGVLLAYCLGKNRSHLYTHPEAECSEELSKQFQSLIARRLKGEPIAYLTGTREFWSLPLMVNQECLIPRPETELLVSEVLNRLPQQQVMKIADLGTGSGAIALAIASERPHWQVTAADISSAALEVAQHNANRLAISNIEFIQSSWCEQLANDFDAIVANPPYIAADDPHLQQGDLRYEPQQALVAANDGWADLHSLVQQAPSHLKPGGLLLMEHGYQQASELRDYALQHGWAAATSHQDLAGHPRITVLSL